MKKNYASQSGFSLLTALFVLVFVILGSVAIQYFLSSTANGQKLTQRRFDMSILEGMIRLELSKPAAYTSCTQDSISHLWSCTVNPTLMQRFQRIIPGLSCNTPPCGFTSALSIVPSLTQPKAVVSVSYNGNDVRVKTIDVEIPIPKEALTSRSGICGTDKDGDMVVDGYLYKGVLADGTDDCRKLPSCLEGSYFAGLTSSGTSECTPLNENYPIANTTAGVFSISCPSNKYLDSVSFKPSANQHVQITCTDRIDPCNVATSRCPGL